MTLKQQIKILSNLYEAVGQGHGGNCVCRTRSSQLFGNSNIYCLVLPLTLIFFFYSS